MFQSKFIDKFKARILYPITFPKIVSFTGQSGKKKIVNPDRPQTKIRLMRFAFRIAKVTSINSVYVLHIAFHGRIGYVNAPGYYVICAWSLFFFFALWSLMLITFMLLSRTCALGDTTRSK